MSLSPRFKELNLGKFLAAYKNKSVDFFRFPGNYGDSLIWHGSQILLASLNILPNEVNERSSQNNNILFIDGGGNLVDYYSDVKKFLLNKSQVYKEIVILPHTIFGESQLSILASIASKITVFCRERVSAQLVSRRLTDGQVFLWHDCAFYNRFNRVLTGRGVLSAFRQDGESLLRILPKDNIDVSAHAYATKPLDELIATLQRYKGVKTDRLHVAICATLLGKEVTLFPNSYYKNKAVFDYSLKRFQNVRFTESYKN